MFNKPGLALLFTALFLNTAQAAVEKTALSDALNEFQNGHYAQSLTQIETVLKQNPDDASALYWAGVDEFNLQHYDSALSHLDRAMTLDPKGELESAPYFRAQSLYALQNYPAAIPYFKTSIERGVEVAASLYYIGYLQSVLKNYEQAIPPLEHLLKAEEADPQMRSYAAFQLGEIYTAQADATENREKRHQILSQDAIPSYQKALTLAPESDVSTQAQSRIEDDQRKLADQKTETLGGVPIPIKPWVATFTQDLKYDSNIVNQADNKIIKVTYTGSPYERTAAFGKYEFLFLDRIAVTPELGAETNFTGRQNEPLVYSNDNTALNPAVRSRIDHRLWGRPASVLIEYEMSVDTRDYRAVHEQNFYSLSNRVLLGERANPFSTGSTTLYLSYKFYDFTQSMSAQSYTQPEVTLAQNWTLPGGYTLNTSFDYSDQNANDPFNSQRSYLLSLASGIPDLPWKMSIDYSLNLMLVDTEEQSATRGLEKNIAPTVSVTKYLGCDRFSLALSYSFVRNISRDTENYAYSKNVLGLTFNAVF